MSKTLRQEIAEILNFHGDVCSQYGAWLIGGKTIKTVKERNLKIREASTVAQDQIIEAFKKRLPEKKTDTRGNTQNPNNPRYLTKSATSYNQAIKDMEGVLK